VKFRHGLTLINTDFVIGEKEKINHEFALINTKPYRFRAKRGFDRPQGAGGLVLDGQGVQESRL